MICVQCKNEKWSQDICPNCGWGDREASLAKADQFRQSGRYLSAIDFYNKVLSADPENMDVQMLKANCLYLEAVSTHKKSFFDQARGSLEQILQKKWDWEKGHQLRVDLFLSFGSLDELAKEYEPVANVEGPKKRIAQDIVRIIQLSKKFKENPPDVIVEVNLTNEWVKLLKSFWFLPLGIPPLLWLAYKFSSDPHSKEESGTPGLFLVLMIITLMIIAVIYIGMKLYRGNQKKEKEGNKIA